MKRTPLQRRTPLRSSSSLARTGPTKRRRKPREHRRFALALEDTGALMVVRGDPRMPASLRKALRNIGRAALELLKSGDIDPQYLGWLRRQPCCAPNARCTRRSEAHHHNLLGSGMGKKAPDRMAMPLCHLHHVFGLHALAGPFKGWDRARLKAWQDEQCALWRARYEAERATLARASRQGGRT